MPVRILIADDDLAIRCLIRRILEYQPEWQVCGEAENGRDAITKTQELKPDLIVMDLAMPQMNGLEAAREIYRDSPKLPMLLLTVQEVSTELVNEAQKVGFQGAVSKSSVNDVITGIETLLDERNYFKASDIPA
jgi:DNA-binding NarL/FixJ family response regulator